MRQTTKLNAILIKNAKAGLHADGAGLYLQVTSPTAKSWLFRYQLRGHEHWMGLGPFPDVGLAEARDAALAARKLRREGIDPIEARKAERAQHALARHSGTTFAECAERYLASHEAGWRNDKHRAQWKATLETYAFPTIGSVAVQDIDTALILKVLEPIWKTKANTASRIRGRIESVLDWAKARGIRNGGENPARWRGHLDHLLPAATKVAKVEHHAALPYEAIGGFMAELRKLDGVAARALEFIALTAARTGEVLGATGDEIDLVNKVWLIPANRMKSGKEHRVPLSPAAMALLKDGTAEGLVFPAPRGGQMTPVSMLRVLNTLGCDATVHGFRSTFRDWAAERTNFPNHVAEMALAHTIPAAVEKAYRRGDLFEKRRRLMDAWAEFCGKAGEAGKVVSIGAGR
jgi:integrase